MAIVGMHKFNLVLMKTAEDKFLSDMQRFGDVQFENLAVSEETSFMQKEKRPEKIKEIKEKLSSVQALIQEIEKYEKRGIKKLKAKERYEMKSRARGRLTLSFEELEETAGQINIDDILMAYGKIEKSKIDLSKVLYHWEPWLDTQMSDEVLREIRDAAPIIGTVDKDGAGAMAQELLELEDLYLLALDAKDEKALFFILPSAEVRQRVILIIQRFHMQYRTMESTHLSREVMTARNLAHQNIRRRHPSSDRLRMLAKRKEDLQIYYEYLNNELLKLQAVQNFLYSESTVLVKGWIPTEREQEFASILEKHSRGNYVLETDAVPEDSHDVPVKLKNNGFTSAFRNITTMYATPRYNEIDPTPVLSVFYVLFFGMMLCDMGYGLLLVLIGVLAPRLMPAKFGQNPMMKFLAFVGVSTAVWGAVYGSFFGDAIPIVGLINPNTEYMKVLVMSLSFGLVHIFVGLGTKAYMYLRDGRIADALCDVLMWYLTLGGGIVWLLSMFLPVLASAKTIAMWAFAAGLAGLALTGGRKAKGVVGKAGGGFFNLYSITNYVSDIVSYSRLMALGLAGGSIALAVNMLVGMLYKNGFLGIIAGVLVFLIGNVFNMFISTLSAYVHTIRLTYVEFFGKFYSGGGVPFVSFRSKPTYINIIS